MRIANNWGAFLLGASKLVPKLPRADEYAMIAIDQIGYALGDKGRSYVQGFGVNPPLRSHHRAASCPKAWLKIRSRRFNFSNKQFSAKFYG